MISVICKSNLQQCVNVQEVREVQEVLGDPSYPEIRNGSINQTLSATRDVTGSERQRKRPLTIGPGPGSGAFTPSY